jgi:hypothetical protein
MGGFCQVRHGPATLLELAMAIWKHSQAKQTEENEEKLELKL